jgi:hypothetical protein
LASGEKDFAERKAASPRLRAWPNPFRLQDQFNLSLDPVAALTQLFAAHFVEQYTDVASRTPAVRGGLPIRQLRKVEGFDMAKTTGSVHSCPMKITEDDPSRGRGTAEQGIAEEEALKRGMEEKSRKFNGKGGELYAKA